VSKCQRGGIINLDIDLTEWSLLLLLARLGDLDLLLVLSFSISILFPAAFLVSLPPPQPQQLEPRNIPRHVNPPNETSLSYSLR
jgi:hypothetical protein